MVRNPWVWPAPMNKIACTSLGEMANQTVVRSVHNSDHGDFASVASFGGNLKAGDSSPLVSPTTIISMSRGQFNVDVAVTFGVLLTNADNTNAYVIPCKVSHVDDSTIVVRGSRSKPSAAGGSKLDLSISKADFRSLFSKNLCEGFYVSILRKVVEMVSIPITVVTPGTLTPIVEMTNDGFQTVGKKKKGKCKSINGGQTGGHLVKQNVRKWTSNKRRNAVI
nr:hypothetical protein [Tanacetum cinerariifolium]